MTTKAPRDAGARPMTRRALAMVAFVLLASLIAISAAPAQVSPNAKWLTLSTRHFYVHFTPPLEPLARRIAADAERAYEQLSTELHPPRGMIDVVLSDDVDLSNGSATPSPSNRIVIYANPPVQESALRYTNDWGQLVITHELTHIFHLDRTRGIWALSQMVFGRAPLLFPNNYAPSWLTEGLAVYEESRLTGAGRIEGSEHRMIARSAAADHAFPPIGALSLSAPRFPFGQTAYAYGSLFIDYVARTRGEARVRDFVDKSSAWLIPYLIDVPAKRAFGITFSHAYGLWRDSLARAAGTLTAAAPLRDFRDLTRDGVFVFGPRWTGDSSLVYSGAPGRESFGAFRIDLDGRRARVGRRNSQSANVPLSDGSLLYAQIDFVNPYQQRSDLWIQRGGKEHRITGGARLTAPDARADGAIVASQIIPGGTRLVRVSSDGKTITALTRGSYDEQWTEPRWSRAGDRIVASRWLRGNVSQVVVIDTTGRIVRVVSSGHSIEATPSWLPGDVGIVYSSDRSGSTQVYVERFDVPGDSSSSTTYRVSDVISGLFEPQIAPGTGRAAAVLFRPDGYHLGVGTCCFGDALNGAPIVPAYRDTTPARVAPLVEYEGAARPFSPWRTLIPRYWLPTVNQGLGGGYLIGGSTAAADVVGRHAYAASIGIPTNNTGMVSGLAYRYSGLGLPIIDVSLSQDWSNQGNIYSRDAARTVLGLVRRRVRDGDLLATLIRQRYRTSMSVSAGAGLEHWENITIPAGLASLVDSVGALGSPSFPRLEVGAGFANFQRPPYSISPEDGVQLAVTMRDRLHSGANGQGSYTLSTVGAASAFKSIDFPGFAHHVLAVRGAFGIADQRSNGYYEVGGISGSTFEIIPGYSVGEGRKTFGVRGFAPGTVFGIRALTGSAEYRLPLLLTGGAPGTLPFFVGRNSLTVFADYGTAWCPNARPNREVCVDPVLAQHRDIASAGAELNLNLGVLSWDQLTRLRLGVATPTRNGAYFGQKSVQFYVTAGVSF